MKKPSRRKSLVAAALCALAVAGGIGVMEHRAPREARAPDTTLKFAFDWPRGATYTYALAWTGETQVRVQELGGTNKSDGGLDARVALAADLVLRSYGKRGDGYLLSARIESATKHELTVLGRAALPDDDAARAVFEGHEALVDLGATGALRGVYFAKDAPPIFRSMMQSIVELSEVVIPAGAEMRWSATQASPVGRGTVDYFATPEGDAVHVLRGRRPYDEVFGVTRKLAPGAIDERDDATIDLAAGHVTTLDETESVAVHRETPGPDEVASTTAFKLALRKMGHADDGAEPNLAALDVVRAGEIGGSGRAKAQMLEQRVAGLTVEDLAQDLLSTALVGSARDKDWLMRGSGLLKQHPEACLDMVTLFEDPRMNGRGRAQIMDLLAGTGTPKAQEAMREAMESSQARADVHLFNGLLQRFTFVSHPTPETLAYVAQTLREAPAGSGKSAATYALGALAGNALRGGDAEAGPRYGAPMLAALAGARTADEKHALLAGLGNLGWTGAVSKLRELATGSEPDVCSAAAWALRKTDTPEARETLLDLASDPSPEVEERAIEAIGTYPALDASDFAALSHAVVGGATSPSADATLLTLLAAHPEGGEPVTSMLNVLLARNDADKPFAAQIRHTLAAMP